MELSTTLGPELEELKEELGEASTCKLSHRLPPRQWAEKKKRCTRPPTWPRLSRFPPRALPQSCLLWPTVPGDTGKEFWEMWFGPARPAHCTGRAHAGLNLHGMVFVEWSNRVHLPVSVKGGKVERLRYVPPNHTDLSSNPSASYLPTDLYNL